MGREAETKENRPAGLPAKESIVDEIGFDSPGAGLAGAPAIGGAATTYTILRTVETDGYEDDLPAAAVAPLSAPAPGPPSDDFRGTARRVAKTGITRARIESFADVADLVSSLPSHSTMASLRISTAAGSGRVSQERRNVRVTAFLYAASSEEDGDYHLIIGRDAGAEPPIYMTIEISGLPPASSSHHARLLSARTAYKSFFGPKLPDTSYDFYTPPIPVEIEGSLFWDASHARGSRPGPGSLRPNMPVVWEIHPVSKIVFEP